MKSNLPSAVGQPYYEPKMRLLSDTEEKEKIVREALLEQNKLLIEQNAKLAAVVIMAKKQIEISEESLRALETLVKAVG